jgi:Leucine-rich repeat (LRR) protein
MTISSFNNPAGQFQGNVVRLIALEDIHSTSTQNNSLPVHKSAPSLSSFLLKCCQFMSATINPVAIALINHTLLANMAPSQLEWFDISSNQIIGPVPSSLWLFPNLEYLYLRSNQIDGSIPLEKHK